VPATLTGRRQEGLDGVLVDPDAEFARRVRRLPLLVRSGGTARDRGDESDDEMRRSKVLIR
jgi:hypothetical protein